MKIVTAYSLFLLILCSSGCMISMHDDGNDGYAVSSAMSFARANSLREQGKHVESAREFSSASRNANHVLSNENESQQDWEAIEESASFQAAVSFALAGKYELARAKMSSIIRNTPSPLTVIARLRRGQYLIQLDRKDDVTDDFQKVLSKSRLQKFAVITPDWVIEEATRELARLKES